ncbi:hypothetical protein HAX54_001499 [Datura stramonium]|uniref:Uncharacterized protein n=1 Tax=Datura stramonium TaxID=4076 RepID=A0ABS8WQS4_DATST|nr:hypothetical protein [Datura stramonium]
MVARHGKDQDIEMVRQERYPNVCPFFPMVLYSYSYPFIPSVGLSTSPETCWSPADGAKSGVLVELSSFYHAIGRVKPERARRRKGQTLRPNGNEQRRNEKMRCLGHPHLERRVEGFGPVAFPVPLHRAVLVWRVRHQKSGLKLSPYQQAES